MITKTPEKGWENVISSASAKIALELESILSPQRFRHSLGVMKLAAELAQCYGGDAEKAALAGILHDIAREVPSAQLLEEARSFGLPIDSLEEHAPVLLHGKVSALRAKREWGVEDPEVLEAIALHITGDSQMSLTAQLVFLADFAEPGRLFGSAGFARELCYTNLRSALEYVFNQEIIFLLNQGFLVHPKTIAARNRLLLDGMLDP